TGKMIGRGREAAVGALAERRVHGVVLDELVGDRVGSGDTRAAGIVVVKLPGGEPTVLRYAALDLDHSRRTEIGPGEFLLARPEQAHRTICGAGQPRRLDSGFAGVLSAVGG